MLAVFQRELKSYFASPISYIYIAAFYFFTGIFFCFQTLLSNTTDISGIFSILFTICMLLIPILTMRLFSEEQRNKTDQALLTAPISLLALVFGKYLAALVMFLISMLMTLGCAIVIAFFKAPDWAMIFGHFIGLFLLGAALCAIGMFISALTENQVIAAVGGFAASLLLSLWDGMVSIIPSETLRAFVGGFSFNAHYLKFTQGLLDFADIIFFVSVCGVFVFFTVRVFERKRWR